MANNFSGRIWSITQAGNTPFGALNVKIKGGVWSGGAATNFFTMTDTAGRVYTWTYPASTDVLNFQELGWLNGEITFGGTFTGEINLYLGSK
jgi:hypothetical protein